MLKLGNHRVIIYQNPLFAGHFPSIPKCSGTITGSGAFSLIHPKPSFPDFQLTVFPTWALEIQFEVFASLFFMLKMGKTGAKR